MDTIQMLRDSLPKAEAKVEKARAQFLSAEQEYADLLTTLRVLEKLTGQEGSDPPPMSDNGNIILSYLGYGPSEGKAPKDVWDRVAVSEEGLNPDLVRTQLWRMAKRGIIETSKGKYWKPESMRPAKKEEAPDAQTSGASHSSGLATGRGTGFPSTPPGGSIPPSSTQPNAGFDPDIDDDVPF